MPDNSYTWDEIEAKERAKTPEERVAALEKAIVVGDQQEGTAVVAPTHDPAEGQPIAWRGSELFREGRATQYGLFEDVSTLKKELAEKRGALKSAESQLGHMRKSIADLSRHEADARGEAYKLKLANQELTDKVEMMQRDLAFARERVRGTVEACRRATSILRTISTADLLRDGANEVVDCIIKALGHIEGVGK